MNSTGRSNDEATAVKSARALKHGGAAATSEPVASGRGRAERREPAGTARWTFLTNHSHVLIVLYRDPSMVLREVALRVGITERAVQRIIADLEEEGFIERQKVGRKNHYRILTDQPLRHAIEAHRTIGELLSLMDEAPSSRSSSRPISRQ